MIVSIDYDPSEFGYSLGRFRDGETLASFDPPDDHAGLLVDIPESVIAFYLHVMILLDMTQRLLQPYHDIATWPGDPGDPRPPV